MNIPQKAIDAAAEAQRRATTSGACGLNRACRLCDCGRDRFTAEDWKQDTGLEKQVATYVLEAAAPHLSQPPTITTPEELGALPEDSVIRSPDGGNRPGWATVYERWPDGWYGLGMIDEPVTPLLPATVLYTPEDQA